jgi:hypothetical protein
MDTDFTNPMDNLPCEQDVLVLRSITCRLYFLAESCWALLFGSIPIFIFYTMVKDGWPRNILSWIITLILFPLAVFGVALILMFVRSILQLFNPPIKLTLRPKQLMPGGNIELSWYISWSPEIMKNMRIYFEATFTKGSGRSEKTKTIRTIDILQLENPLALNSGNTRFTIPPDVITTTKHDHRDRTITWTLNVEAATRGKRADIDDTFKVSILPLPEPEAPVETTSSNID